MVPEECANIIGDTYGSHVIPFGRMQRAHLRARRVDNQSTLAKEMPYEHHSQSWQAAP